MTSAISVQNANNKCGVIFYYFLILASSDDVFHPEHRTSLEQRIPIHLEEPEPERPLRPHSGKFVNIVSHKPLLAINVSLIGSPLI